MTVEHTILSQLLTNDGYAREVLPHLRSSYFHEAADKALFKTYVEYWNKYNVAPTKNALSLELSNRDDISDTEYDDATGIIDHSLVADTPDDQWLLDTTESWCQEKAVYNAIMDSIAIIDGEDATNTRHGIPDILKEALAVSFTTAIGHDYLEEAERRFEFYNTEHERIPFDLTLMNKITNGGVPKKTLNVILAGTNVGKTLGMVHFAATHLKQGKNVLYITLEMAEEMIANRIDANLFDMEVNDVDKMTHEAFHSKINKIQAKTQGKLIIKEYPTATAHAGHFRNLLQELKMQKGFVPDVIFIDYIGIAASSRVKLANTNSYFYIKAIAEEWRGLAVEFNLPLWTAVQATRGGFGNADMDITDTAESFGLPATADLMFGIIRTDELDAINQLLVKQLKNRYGNKSFYEKFVIGVHASKMQLFDVEQSAQGNIQGAAKAPMTEDEQADRQEKRSRFKNFKM